MSWESQLEHAGSVKTGFPGLLAAADRPGLLSFRVNFLWSGTQMEGRRCVCVCGWGGVRVLKNF